MKQSRVEFDVSYLNELIEVRVGRGVLAKRMGVAEGRLDILLRGEDAFKMHEMLRCAALLRLDSVEFERCFFSAKSSEILNKK